MRISKALLVLPLLAWLCRAEPPAALMREPAVHAALEAAKSMEPRTVAQQIRICEIAAPPFHEGARGEELKRFFTKLRLQNVHVDSVGNVIGTRPGRSEHPHVVFSAHLDTVFPQGTNVKVSREGTVLKGPGIGDDCRGLAVLLAIIQSLEEANVQTPGTITFVADVGEEGLGDLRGAKNLFSGGRKGEIDKFVSIDGTGYGIVTTGVGSIRYRVTFRGPGGHSYGSFGMANPIHALGRAISKVDDFQVPSDPKTTFNVGRIGGGTSINSIASQAWMEVDLRSSGVPALRALNHNFRAAVRAAVEEENRRWNNRGKVSASIQRVGTRPAGRTPVQSAIVETALGVSRALGLEDGLRDASTDANVPMNLNIPAITIGGGGRGAGAHSPEESFDTKDSWLGTERAVLLAIALAR
jgi:tripeptide aminopeptidase